MISFYINNFGISLLHNSHYCIPFVLVLHFLKAQIIEDICSIQWKIISENIIFL